MRMALHRGQSLKEFEEGMGSDEWEGKWLPFLAEYDLPDGYFVAGQVCSVLANVFGNDSEPSDFVPFFRAPRATRAKTPEQLRAKFAGIRADLAAAKKVRGT